MRESTDVAKVERPEAVDAGDAKCGEKLLPPTDSKTFKARFFFLRR
jgi:hypothetical protein